MFRICAMVIIMVLLGSSVSLAALNLKADGAGILAWAFVGFIALFVISHLIPASIQCVGLFRCALQPQIQSKNR
ncbi:MAG: hypothetical protein RBR06_01195 [Desulfuromonadaceae bacterium]|nr:hypothetical protein [Desulfuromonadaceae bacterium]